MRLEKMNGIVSAGFLPLFWFLLLIATSIKIRTLIYNLIVLQAMTPTPFRFVIFTINYCCIVLSFVLSLFSDLDAYESRKFREANRNHQPCPEATASILSRLTFWWMTSLITSGYKKPLVAQNLSSLNECDMSKILGPRFQHEWEKGANKNSKRGKWSLAIALFRTAGRPFIIGGLLKFVNDLLAFLSPQLLRLLINFSSDKSQPIWLGLVLAVSMFLLAVVRSLILQQYFHRCFGAGMKLKTAVTWAVYRKALILSSHSRQKLTTGEIVNLMSVDAQQFIDLTPFLHSIWCSPIQIAIAIYFLYQIMGPSVFAGLAVLILIVPLNAITSAKIQKLQEKQMINKDDRIRLMSEILNGIKVLKLYAWEQSFIKRVLNIRDKELQILRRYGFLYSTLECSWSATGFLVGLATFGTYVLTGQELLASRAFVALSLFSILRFAVGVLPLVVISLVQARVSINRLYDFLISDELDPGSVQQDMPPNYGDSTIVIKNGTFSWSPEDCKGALRKINFQIDRGSLTAIVGHVGSGKSSLLSAILGEMEKKDGNVFVNGSIAYVPQLAWILNDTVKNNILYGTSFNKNEYRKVIEICALKPDLEILPGADETEIGEKGINLSGGQKQRISIARAVYAKRDIYLLDDPLSAVDAHVGKHLFKEVIGPQGRLRDKTRILVTHNLRFLSKVDKIIMLEDGEIIETGTYSELMYRRGAFSDLIQAYANTAENDRDNIIEEINIEPRQLAVVSPAHGAQLVEDESIEVGRVKYSVYTSYIKSFGWKFVIMYLLFEAGDKGCMAGVDAWLALWSSAKNSSVPEIRDFYLGIYGAIGGILIFISLLSTIVILLAGIKASRQLHNNLLDNVLRLPMSFFDTNPMGRVLNRFSKDINTIDEVIPVTIDGFMAQCYVVALILVVVSASTPYFLTVILPLFLLYYFIQRFYIATSRQLRRLESVSRSPIYSFFTESLQGMSVLRAYNSQNRFVKECDTKIDENQMAYYLYISSNRWLSIRLEFIGNLVVLFASLLVVLGRETLPTGIVGLSITYALQMTDELNWMVRQSSDLETNIVAVERVKEYSEITKEASWYVDEENLSSDWPSHGDITFNNFKVRYRADLDLVLKGISCNIRPTEKVGIIGRTGSGKTSLVMALFRIIEAAEGSITIDGVDIAKIGLHTLRSKLSIIPQDPVLFCGTLRNNLDPFEKHSDDELWLALENAHLKTFVSGLDERLEHKISEGGENLSVGQRQLICLARALLRHNKIIILDEATAAVDMETDNLIQGTIRNQFKDCTILTIAHRLNTIMDSDKIMVIDAGKIAEFDSPSRLLSRENSIFLSMAKEANLIETG
ncbi:uncharacterized protein TRIADDRAFT_50060 [Trichoplax adhaerens]|uniref:ABC-type glutathione-S-conjugate transporter n=1 Tax=Trichoplax adhaerens TaxID=10228 RepID=B3RSQ0_TRIAD|nr:hypothetical protein TRIADDRAFT_50060 [Trichoplax adhaerens]EDV26556.1 hypothetical protein TRIADDRAFT_50060 [Trichoplax adhaerens]|eukprot:XP_002110552.1 hypothetical protein TRIADDRAFT_50060 [Trichoplax adhaerens]